LRRSELIANLVLLFGVPLLGVIIGCAVPLLVDAPLKFTLIMLVLWIVGFSMFFKAKLSVIRQGKLISFGVRNMSQTNRICYILGYVLMGTGLIFSLGIIAFYR
jgi:hypothetical protein